MISIQKPLQYCKVISLQLNKLIKKKRIQGAVKKKKKRKYDRNFPRFGENTPTHRANMSRKPGQAGS